MVNNENGTSTGKKSIISDITASSIFGILNTSFMVSYATLIFAKTCPDYFGTAVALLLLGACVVSILLALMSTYSGSIGSIQDVPSAIAAIIAVSFAQVLTSASPATIFANIFIAIALSTLMTGICFLLLGYFKLGNLVRFIPYPVLGGFLAATGWLLFTGGIQVSTGVAFKIINIPAFIKLVDFVPLMLGLMFGFGLLLLTTRYPKNMLITPACILLSIVLFLVITLSMGMTIDQLKGDGWLLGPLPDGALWRSVSLPDISLVDWPLVFKHAGSITTIVILSAISFLLNSSGIEIIAGRDLDMNKDLKATGITNLVTSIIAAPASYVLVSQTALATRIGANSRLVGVLQGIFLLIVFFVGGAFLSFFPKFVAGGLLIFLGASMLKEWIIDGRKSISRIDYGIIVGIVLVVEFFGFLEGVAVGIIAAVVIFVFRYSTINIIKEVMDGTQIRSSKDRPITDQRVLDHHADELVALQLQGFIFFGTANSFYENVKKLVTSADKPIRYIVMDLKLVQGIDSSAVKSFAKLAKYLEQQVVTLLLVNLSDQLRKTFEVDGFTNNNYAMLHEYSDLDYATEYCEDQIIQTEIDKLEKARQEGKDTDSGLMQAVYSDMMAALDIQVMFEELTERMQTYLDKLEISIGDRLYKQNEISSDIYFIIRGQITLSRTNREGRVLRIRTLGPWTITGELGSFLAYRSPYDADVVKDGVVLRLSAENHKRLEKEDPDLVSEFQRLIINMLGNQLMKTSHVVGGSKF